MRVLMTVRMRFARTADGFALEVASESNPDLMMPIVSFVRRCATWWWAPAGYMGYGRWRGPWVSAWGAVRDARRHGWIRMRDIPGMWERSTR